MRLLVSIPDSVLTEHWVDEAHIPRAYFWTADSVIRVVYLSSHNCLYNRKRNQQHAETDKSNSMERHRKHFTLKWQDLAR